MKFDLIRVLFGSFVATTSIMSILVYMVVQKIILSNSGCMKYSSYKIILIHGFIDIIQLFSCIFYGIFAIIGTTINKSVEKFVGFQFNLCWYIIGSLTVLLAINRLALLYFGGKAEHFFNSKRISVMLILTIAFSTMISLIWLTPYATYGFDAETLMWIYDSFDFMPVCDRLFTLITSIISVICNILLLVIVLKRQESNKLNDNSKRLTLQIIINGTYTVFVSIYFMFIRISYVPFTTVYNAIDILLCVLWSGKNPILHLIFIRSIRENFLEYYQKSKMYSCFGRPLRHFWCYLIAFKVPTNQIIPLRANDVYNVHLDQ